MTNLLEQIRTAFRALSWRTRADNELNDELGFHLEREIQERVAHGMTPDDARRVALRSMGAVEKHKEECRDVRAGHVSEFVWSLLKDASFALRLFRKHRVPVGIAVGGLGLALGVVTAIFSVVNASFLRPYGMDDPSSVVAATRGERASQAGWPYADFLHMKNSSTLAAVEATGGAPRVRFAAAPDPDVSAERAILLVSGGYLGMLGGRPVMGRTLVPSDDAPGAPAVVVVSYRLWRTELHADPSAIGRTVWVNGSAAQLVGVLRPDFTGPETVPPSIWAPLGAVDDLHLGPVLTPTSRAPVKIVARLAPGAALVPAEHELTAIVQGAGGGASSDTANASTQAVRLERVGSPISGESGGDTYPTLLAILVLSGLVLGLACANTANLLMAAAVTRMREMGVRLALGATRARLIRQVLVEGLLLGLTAGALGFLIAIWIVPIVGAMVEMSPEIDLAPDGRTLLFALVVATLCGIGAGLAPARYGARGQVLAALQGQRPGGGGRFPSRLRTAFIGFQSAVSMLLLVCAALLTRTALLAEHIDIRFDAERLVAVTLEPLRGDLDTPAFVQAALAAVRRVPSVESVSVTESLPLRGTGRDRVTYEGRSYDIRAHRTDARYFSTAGINVLRGRAFTTEEVSQETSVALVSETVRRIVFNGRDPVGRTLICASIERGRPDEAVLVIGVVADAMLSYPTNEDRGDIFRPTSSQFRSARVFSDQGFKYPPNLLVRTATPATTVRAIEEAIQAVDSGVRPRTDLVQSSVERYVNWKRMLAWMLGPVAVLALLLAALGVYGVTAFVTRQRMEEVSVRMAIGASPADVLRLLVADGLRPVLTGLAAGLFLALIVGRLIARPLNISGISSYDPLSVGCALSALLLFALAAVAGPALGAARSDPARLLRQG